MVGPIENFGEAKLRNVLRGFAKGGGRLGPFRGLRLTTCRAVSSGEPQLGAISSLASRLLAKHSHLR